MEKIAIIPIRKDSKRFIDKNFSNFKSTNLIMNTISKLIEAKIYLIYISTDVPETVLEHINHSQPCKDFNKAIIFIINRPSDLALDDTKTEEVITHAISCLYKIPKFEDKDNINYTIILCQVTSPLWSAHRLIHGIEEHLSYKFPVISINPNYEPNGCFYIFTKEQFIENKGIYSSKMRFIEIPWNESIDIDHEYQLKIAESI